MIQNFIATPSNITQPAATLRAEARITVRPADADDRDAVYRARHDVYAAELRQHRTNADTRLRDALDERNVYLIAEAGGALAGFVSITPPPVRTSHGDATSEHPAFSIDKYFDRQALPIVFDEATFEVRLLTVLPEHRQSPIALALMYAAMRWIESHGGERIVAIGRAELIDMYRRVGLQPLDFTTQSGAVKYQLMTAEIAAMHEHIEAHLQPVIKRLMEVTDWRLEVPMRRPDRALPALRKRRTSGSRSSGKPRSVAEQTDGDEHCYHGGAFFDAIGVDFRSLQRADDVINADVLDAWFPPSPKVTDALVEHLPWLLRTSPPTQCEGMVHAIAKARGVEPHNIVTGGGSSDLIYLALRHWLSPQSRVLILDPMYGEYAHVLEHVVGCRVDRFTLDRARNYDVDPLALERAIDEELYDLVILVNPNSPTGRHLPARTLKQVLKRAPATTRFWIDETYIDYVGKAHSLEPFAASRNNVVICKSMSKVYALSGVRAAYLCGPRDIIADLRMHNPPWAVSLPAQVAATKALEDNRYYAACYRQTHELRARLVKGLDATGCFEQIVPGCGNFILAHLRDDPALPDAATLVAACREYDLFIRDASNMGTAMGDRAVRFAVKDRETNARMLDILNHVFAALSDRAKPRPAGRNQRKRQSHLARV